MTVYVLSTVYADSPSTVLGVFADRSRAEMAAKVLREVSIEDIEIKAHELQ